MATLSVGKAWEETVVFVRREAPLMLPVALLFMALPVVILGQMVPADFMTTMEAGKGQLPRLPASLWLAMLVTLVLIQLGSLALLALALKPGISVSEAIGLGVRRLPAAIGAILLSAAAALLLTILVSIVGGLLSFVIGSAAMALSLAVVFALILLVGVRLALLSAVIADQDLGPLASMRLSWSMTAGNIWRLLGFLILSAIVAQLLSLAFGSLFGILGGLIGGRSIATLLSGLASALVAAGVQIYLFAMLARLYRQAAD